ncbi:hypothetical protein ACKKBG_A08140 [Auxenochlorella protothecoides x Auxenochlorella symbiontica]
MIHSKLKSLGRSGSQLSLRPAGRTPEATSLPLPNPGPSPKPCNRNWKWKGLAAVLVGAVLLGAWCAFTLDTRQLDRAQRLVRQASRRDIEAGAEAGNYMFPGLLSRASDCARSLALPQVALLFLVRGPMPHEVTWTAWLDQLAGLLPAAVAEEGALPACPTDPTPGLHPSLARQHLFTLYVHSRRGASPGYRPGSLFHGTELAPDDRVEAEWGGHSLVTATKALLGRALEEPLNAKFLLVSETTLPMYSPHMVYRQLLSSPKSSLNACNESHWYRAADQRWVPEFESASLKLHHWRKSWQWFALSRVHARLVVADVEVEAQFQQHCRPSWVPEWRTFRVCYSDEHYIPTLLAVHGLDNETDCSGSTTDANWDRRADKYSPHPYEYTRWDIRLGLLAAVRRSSLAQCAHGERENRSVRGGFLQLGQDPAPSPEDIAAAARRAAGFAPLGRDCPLLARKFGEGVVAQALALFLRCHPSIGVLNGGDCRDGRGLSHRLASAALPWAAAAAVCSAAALLSGAMALLLQALFLQHLAEHAPHDAPQV